jgi:hypothetical protein
LVEDEKVIYEYQCSDGHVIEAHVKLNGEGTPEKCTVEVTRDTGCLECGVEKYPCGKPLKKIISLGSPYFPGAGSWRGA